MSVKASNYKKMFLDLFVPVWHPLHVTLQIFMDFSSIGGHLGNMQIR